MAKTPLTGPAIIAYKIKPHPRLLGFADAVKAKADEVANEMLLDFELTTWTWTHKVKFRKIVHKGRDSVEALVGTDDPIYKYVDEGTRPHMIYPKKAKALHFKGTYKSKTLPGVMVARPGGASGKDVFAKAVKHPGTKARKFSQKLSKEWEKKLAGRLDTVIKRYIKASGHTM